MEFFFLVEGGGGVSGHNGCILIICKNQFKIFKLMDIRGNWEGSLLAGSCKGESTYGRFLQC